jgi:hypothetical protein
MNSSLSKDFIFWGGSPRKKQEAILNREVNPNLWSSFKKTLCFDKLKKIGSISPGNELFGTFTEIPFSSLFCQTSLHYFFSI